MQTFHLRWWQTWKCNYCGVESRLPGPGMCGGDEGPCPRGVVLRWSWLRPLAAWLKANL